MAFHQFYEARFSEEWIYLHDIKEIRNLLFERCISEGKFNFYFNDDEDLEMIKWLIIK